MIKTFLNAIFENVGFVKPVSYEDMMRDCRTLADLFARTIEHKAMTPQEHADCVFGWMIDPAFGKRERIKYATLIDMELAHQMTLYAVGAPQVVAINGYPIAYEEAPQKRGPMYRDVNGHYRVSTRPYQRRDMSQVMQDQTILTMICRNLDISFIGNPQAEIEKDTPTSRVMTEAMMVQLRRHGPNSRYVQRL